MASSSRPVSSTIQTSLLLRTPAVVQRYMSTFLTPLEAVYLMQGATSTLNIVNWRYFLEQCFGIPEMKEEEIAKSKPSETAHIEEKEESKTLQSYKRLKHEEIRQSPLITYMNASNAFFYRKFREQDEDELNSLDPLTRGLHRLINMSVTTYLTYSDLQNYIKKGRNIAPEEVDSLLIKALVLRNKFNHAPITTLAKSNNPELLEQIMLLGKKSIPTEDKKSIPIPLPENKNDMSPAAPQDKNGMSVAHWAAALGLNLLNYMSPIAKDLCIKDHFKYDPIDYMVMHQEFGPIIALRADYESALIQIAKILENLKQYQKALFICNGLLANYPVDSINCNKSSHVTILSARMELYFCLEQYKDALNDIEKILEKDDIKEILGVNNFLYMIETKGVILGKLGHHAKGLKIHTSILEQNDLGSFDITNTLLNAARATRILITPENVIDSSNQMIEWCSTVIERESATRQDLYEAYVEMSYAYCKLDRIDEALIDFEKAFLLSPNLYKVTDFESYIGALDKKFSSPLFNNLPKRLQLYEKAIKNFNKAASAWEGENTIRCYNAIASLAEAAVKEWHRRTDIHCPCPGEILKNGIVSYIKLGNRPAAYKLCMENYKHLGEENRVPLVEIRNVMCQTFTSLSPSSSSSSEENKPSMERPRR